FFFQAEDGIRDATVTGVQTCALPIYPIPEQRFASSDADLGYSHCDKHPCHAFDLIEREKICRRKPAHGRFVRHAKQAREVAAVGDRNSELGRDPTLRVDEKSWDRGFSKQARQKEATSL